jgi:hypothetical protein
MYSALSRIAPVALSLATLAGCAIAPADERSSNESEPMLITPVPILVDWPLTYCTSTTADHSTGYPASPGYRVEAASDASKTCDYYVTEVTGVKGKNITLAIAEPSPAPQLVTDSASCSQSYETFETYGYIPQHWEMNGQGLWYPVAGAWERISTKTIYGQYLSSVVTGANCVFNTFVNLYPAGASGTAQVTNSPYSTIRVATKAVMVAPSGTYRSAMDTYVVPAQ